MVNERSHNFIYGGEVFLKQKSWIKPKDWNGNEVFNWYLLRIIRKEIDYFEVWGNLKGKSFSMVMMETEDDLDREVREIVGCEKDDCIQEPNGRVYFWSEVNLKKLGHQTSGRGHGANNVTFKGNTFCARDRGMVYLGEDETP